MIAATTLLTLSAFVGERRKASYQYVLATASGMKPTLRTGGYIPFDWAFGEIPAVGAVPGESVKLTWNQANTAKNSLNSSQSARLRITSATDVREAVEVTVKTAILGKVIGVLDIQFAMYLQPFELVIQPADLETVLAEGVTLTMTKGSKPFWFFTAGDPGQSAPDAYLPHLLLHDASDRTGEAAMAGTPDRWKERLLSLGSVQTFGWMEGCVLDGLHELSNTSPRAKRVLDQHLDLFFANNSLVYANLNNQKAVGTINTVESILPFAILAQTNPTHPLLQTAIAFCERHANADGVIADGTGTNRPVKTEECYTVSYPLAVLAKTLSRPDLTQLAIQTALARVRLLAVGTSIYQRGNEQRNAAQEAPVFENWSRGVAWYLLGLVKTLVHLPDTVQSQPLKLALQTAVDIVLTRQQPNGLWYCFMHQPETGYETSGTAGIAAALTYGVQKRLLPETVLKAAINAQKGLLPFFTPDGYLTGTAQGNKGGPALQREGFRVISPYTLGFLAHLDLPKS